MILTQRATTDIIDAKILTHCSYRVCLASSSKQESINVLNCDIAYELTIKGRGYLSVNGHLTEFQSYYYKQPKIQQNDTVETIKNDDKIEIRDEGIIITINQKINENEIQIINNNLNTFFILSGFFAP